MHACGRLNLSLPSSDSGGGVNLGTCSVPGLPWEQEDPPPPSQGTQGPENQRGAKPGRELLAWSLPFPRSCQSLGLAGTRWPGLGLRCWWGQLVPSTGRVGPAPGPPCEGADSPSPVLAPSPGTTRVSVLFYGIAWCRQPAGLRFQLRLKFLLWLPGVLACSGIRGSLGAPGAPRRAASRVREGLGW